MHVDILIKIKADSEDEALSDATNQVEESCGDGKPFDYVSGEPLVVTKAVLKRDGVMDYATLEKNWKKHTNLNLARHKASLKDIFLLELAKRHLSGKEALLYTGRKDQYGNDFESLTEVVEASCKTKESKPEVPKDLDELAEEIVDILSPANVHSMFGYHLKYIEKLQTIKLYPEKPSNTLYCADNNYANLGGKGKHTYYIIFDRHY
jgi:hypothetical protein